MYTEVVEFRFNDEVAPSRRFAFLAELAEACEQHSECHPNHHYFVISIERNSKCSVDFMMPSVFEVGSAKLQIAQREGLLKVIKPKNFGVEDNKPNQSDV